MAPHINDLETLRRDFGGDIIEPGDRSTNRLAARY